MPPIPGKPRPYQLSPQPRSNASDICYQCHIRFRWIGSARNLCWWCETDNPEHVRQQPERNSHTK